MGNIIHRGAVDPDTQWRKQIEEMDKNPMYEFINLSNGGSLIKAMKEGRTDEARKIVQGRLKPFLYNEGKGKFIDENSTWGQIKYPKNSFNKFQAHEACWDLEQRGGVGETPLHLAQLLKVPESKDVTRILLDEFPKLALDLYEGDEYFGESSLHLAVVRGDLDIVRWLVDCGAVVNQRATGRFFLPEDQISGRSQNTNYKGHAYFGEYPLAFAACFTHKDIYDFLIQHGADPNSTDSFGNNVLHMIVIANQPDMVEHAVYHPTHPVDKYRKNLNDLTPLALASKLGRREIFEKMLELDSVEQWRYSNIICSCYPLTDLDSIGPKGETNWNSALMIILNGQTEEHLDMVEGGVIRQLLQEKWNTFAKSWFIARMVFGLLYLILMSIAIYTRPKGSQLLGNRGAEDVVRYIAEILVCILSLTTLIMDGVIIALGGFRAFIRNCMHAPAQTINMISCLLILLCIPLRIARYNTAEDALLIVAVPGAWMFLLFFASVVELTGPFVTMIYRMITGDLFRFGLIYFVFFVGFTQGFFFLFRDTEQNDTTGLTFSTIEETIVLIFHMTLGEFQYEEFDNSHYPKMTKIVFILFMILFPILLLNMLIAMMGNTYTQVISQSTKVWTRQWAKIVVVLERGFTKKQLLKFQEKYAVKIAVPHSDNNVVTQTHPQTLVVIKSLGKPEDDSATGSSEAAIQENQEVTRM